MLEGEIIGFSRCQCDLTPFPRIISGIAVQFGCFQNTAVVNYGNIAGSIAVYLISGKVAVNRNLRGCIIGQSD